MINILLQPLYPSIKLLSISLKTDSDFFSSNVCKLGDEIPLETMII